MAEKILKGLTCPSCSGELEIREGIHTFNCKYCGTLLITKGSDGALKFYVPNKLQRNQAIQNAFNQSRTFRGGCLRHRTEGFSSQVRPLSWAARRQQACRADFLATALRSDSPPKQSPRSYHEPRRAFARSITNCPFSNDVVCRSQRVQGEIRVSEASRPPGEWRSPRSRHV